MSESREQRMEQIRRFRMPSYREIPDVGLYLEQGTRFAAEYLSPLEPVTITGSMISNYVKKKLVKNPVKKMYYRDQIAVILFIAVAKTVISLDEVQALLKLQQNKYTCREAYEYFCRELEGALAAVFGETAQEPVDDPECPEKVLLRGVLTAVAQKVYLDHAFRALMEQ